MNENPRIHLVDVPIGGQDGFLWNRLHAEREEICEAMLQDCGSGSQFMFKGEGTARTEQRELQARLRNIDDALDRLMAGSFR